MTETPIEHLLRIFPEEGVSCKEEIFLLSESISVPVVEILRSGLFTPWVHQDNYHSPSHNFLLQTTSGDYSWFDRSGNPIPNPGTLSEFTSHLFEAKSTRVSIPDGFSSIHKDTFYSRDVEEVVIPRSVRRIGPHAFGRCRKLRSVEIPSGVSEIGDFAFRSSGLERIVLGTGLRCVGRGVFLECLRLEEAEIGDGPEVLPKETFAECRRLERVSVPGSVREIEPLAFVGCFSLRKVRAPAHLRKYFLVKSSKVLSHNMFGNPQVEFEFF